MKEAGFDFGEKPCTDIYIGSMGDAGQQLAMKLAKAVREDGYRAECDMCARSVMAQLKYADKTGAKYCLIIGDNEVESKTGSLKNLRTGSQTQIALDDTFADSFLSVEMADSIAFEEEL
jgi:histidyl-tRNA synthetase